MKRLLTLVFIASILALGLSSTVFAATLYQTKDIGCDTQDREVKPPYKNGSKKYYCISSLEAGEWTAPPCPAGASAAIDKTFGNLCLTKPDKYTFSSEGGSGANEKIGRNESFESAECTSGDHKKLCNLFDDYINPAIKFFTIGFGVIVVIMIIVGGIQYSASGGDPQAVANAKKKIYNALLALLAYSLLFAFLQFLVPGGVF